MRSAPSATRLPDTAKAMARGAVLGARGNSGMMLAHFLLGFADALGDRPTANAVDIAGAIHSGSDRLYASLDDPREGTILTVAREAAAAAERVATPDMDIREFMHRLLDEGEVALARTPELMAVLKEAGVVDAGGKGFVRMIEGVVRFIEGDPILPAGPVATGEFLSPAALADVVVERDFQYCTEVMVRGEQIPRPTRCARPCGPSGGRYRSWSAATCSKCMCTPIPRRPSLPMPPAGAPSRQPRPTTCGPSTGACPMPPGGRLRW